MSGMWFNSLSVAERITQATAKVEAMIDELIEIAHLDACNRIIVHSDRLKSQIPRSYAGVAYRIFSKALLQREMAGICTLWDPPARDRNSLPTVAALIDCDGVRELVEERKRQEATEGRHLDAESNDSEMLAWITELSDEDIAKTSKKRARLLDEAVAEIGRIEASDLLRAARDFRDIRLAHNLSTDAKKYPSLNARVGDESQLLSLTVPILNRVDLVVRSSTFDWESTLRIAKRNAESLWHGCRFNVRE